MMCLRNDITYDTIDAVLPTLAAGEIRRPRHGCWEFLALDAAGLVVEVRWASPWLQVATALAGGHVHGIVLPRVAWELLAANGALAGPAKFAVLPGRQNVEVVCDSAVESQFSEDQGDRAARLAGLIKGGINNLAHAVEHVRNTPPRAGELTVAEAQPSTDFVELCSVIDWQCHFRAGGKALATLDISGLHLQASLEQSPAPRALVELPVAPSSDATRQAVGVLLLQLGGLVRLVRPAARAVPADAQIYLEVPFTAPITAAEVGHALSALSLACRLVYREAAALSGNEDLARHYLAIRGLSAELPATPVNPVS